MGIIGKIFGKEVVASASIRDEISAAEAKLVEMRSELTSVLGGIALMSDAQHVKAEERAASINRAIARLDAKVGELELELPAILRAEEVAEQAAAETRLRQRAEAARSAVKLGGLKLLSQYDELAESLAGVLIKIVSLDEEVRTVNQLLAAHPVAEAVRSVSDTHRRNPDRPAFETREMRPVWVSRDPFSGEEHVSVATLNREGEPVPVVPPSFSDGVRRVVIQPRLENREVVVARGEHRQGAYLCCLSEVRLPPGTVGSQWHWPRSN